MQQLTGRWSLPYPTAPSLTFDSPKCPQSKVPLRIEDGIIGLPPSLARHAEDIYDEFNCLHLNITTPANSPAGLNLPVMVYIHGGGGRGGSNSDWWNDGGSLVKKSIEIRKPVIHVAIK
jgi:carboxylesterase type B